MFKQRRPVKRILVVTIIFSLLLGGFLFLDRRVRPTVHTIAEVKATQMAVDAIQTAVRSEISQNNINYQDFISWQKDNQGRVAVMQANTVRVNQMQADMALEVLSKLQQLEGEVIAVPLGQILGSYILAHWGPRVPVRIMPIGTVDVQIDDSFTHAGINQTRHKIYLDFTTMVKIAIPLGGGEVKVATQVPVAESVIVGEVPEVVADFSGGIFGIGN
ncbi:MAG: sporulation protein YunB [Firmicutes bacterium]|nr:sporulation protein YunB [Bacillota bacterium]